MNRFARHWVTLAVPGQPGPVRYARKRVRRRLKELSRRYRLRRMATNFSACRVPVWNI